MRAVQIQKTGGPDVLNVIDLPKPTPAAGQILIKHAAIGLNFIDTYQRVGLYPLELPTVLGREGSGVVEAAGVAGEHFDVGQEVVAEGDGLGGLEVGEAGHDGGGVFLGTGGQSQHEVADLEVYGVRGVADEETEIGGDLVVAAAGGV